MFKLKLLGCIGKQYYLRFCFCMNDLLYFMVLCRSVLGFSILMIIWIFQGRTSKILNKQDMVIPSSKISNYNNWFVNHPFLFIAGLCFCLFDFFSWCWQLLQMFLLMQHWFWVVILCWKFFTWNLFRYDTVSLLLLINYKCDIIRLQIHFSNSQFTQNGLK